MFVVKGLQRGKSSLSGKEGEMLSVRCEKGCGCFEGLLTPKEFLAQVRLHSHKAEERQSVQS